MNIKKSIVSLLALIGLALFATAGWALSPSDIDDTTADYFTDQVDVFFEERSAEPLKLVNEILCYVRNTKYDQLVNYNSNSSNSTAMFYRAQVDAKKCESERDSAGGAGAGSQNQSSGANSPEYTQWIVKSLRTNSTQPQELHVWTTMPGHDEEPGMHIRAKGQIFEGATATNPYGRFRLDFKISQEGTEQQDNATAIGKGYIKTDTTASGESVLRFVENFDFSTNTYSIGENSTATMQRSPDGTKGSGRTALKSLFNGQVEEDADFAYAYDTDNFLRVDSDTNQKYCLSLNDFNESVWFYGLYNATGNRVSRNAGFPIAYSNATGEHQGWIGYYGLWFPEGSSIPDGATVTKQDFGPGGNVQNATYETFIKGGKLIKHTKKSLALGELMGVPLQYNDYDSTTQTSTEYRVQWNGSAFAVVAKLEQTGDQYLWKNPDASDPDSIDLTALNMPDLNFWSQEMGGSVRIKLDSCTQNNDNTFTCTAGDNTTVDIYEEAPVFPGDAAPSTLYCYNNCVQSGTSGLEFQNKQEYQNASPANSDKFTYSFETDPTAANYLLLLDFNLNPMVETSSSDQHPYGLHTGALVTAAQLGDLACDFDQTNSTTCAWQAWNLNSFYTWETGPNNWNKLTALVNATTGAPLAFEAPLKVVYQRATSSGTNTYYLDYNGFGELHGIPGRCVDWNTGEAVDCEENTRWVPEFSIADGSEVCDGSYGNGTCSGTAYLVKGLEKEKMMKEDPNGCLNLTTSTYTLPSIDDWQDPSLGAQPTVNEPPLVIDGVVQTQ